MARPGRGAPMAEILLFHHALGLTPGIRHLATTLRGAGHTVHLPDLYDGRVLPDLAQGLDHAREVGFGTLLDRGRHAADGLPDGLVYVGFSLGVVPAQALAQTRPGARGALLVDACLPPTEFGDGWPAGVPVQVHGMDADEIFVGEGDLDAARALVEATPQAELFLYPGKSHLFADDSLPSYDAAAATLLTTRMLDFLTTIG
ncbi:dienelactone hydrolase family protein [Micromonospora coxensis]|uniref:dienelactone hydrolase family protein n=1 Tax=Micromonospora coxensis TaxID=356852 RepID=UPI0034411255